MHYHEKYDPDNEGTQYVFNEFYRLLANKHGMRSNLIACCGEDGQRYKRYAKMICSTGKARAYFIENNYKRYGKLYDMLRGAKRIRLIYGNVFNYINNPAYRESRPCRLEDLGLGIGLRRLVYSAIPLLNQQRELCHYHHWKAQILDGAIRQLPKSRILSTLQAYLDTIDLRIKAINGSTSSRALEVCNAEEVHKYLDHSGKIGKVYKFSVELYPNKRSAHLYMYCCLNGSPMMQTMIVYK